MDFRQRVQWVIDQNPDFTVRNVSLRAGMSDSMLNKFLRGATESMTIANAEKLAKALDVDARWLIFGEGDPIRASDVTSVLRRIPEDQIEQALRVLEAFARTGTDG